jgi:site-specific DNA-cytosine methylase
MKVLTFLSYHVNLQPPLAYQTPSRSTLAEHHMPRLTLQIVIRLQGLSCDWNFAWKTASSRQIGNVFPLSVAKAVVTQLRLPLEKQGSSYKVNNDKKAQLQLIEAKT